MYDLKRVRKYLKVTQLDFAEKIGVTQGYISEVENGKSTLSEKTIERIEAEYTIKLENYLIEKNTVNEARPIYYSGKHDEDDVIYHVPVMAEAGFTAGYKSPQSNGEMERYYLPGLPGGGYSFEVTGESMVRTLSPREVIITFKKPIERGEDLAEGKIYVFVMRDGICIKRFGGYEDGYIILLSDNPNYEPVRILNEDIINVYKVRRVLKHDLDKINV
jgi:phage repressor protein C with HTH and peptisase S24 domain